MDDACMQSTTMSITKLAAFQKGDTSEEGSGSSRYAVRCDNLELRHAGGFAAEDRGDCERGTGLDHASGSCKIHQINSRQAAQQAVACGDCGRPILVVLQP